MKTIIAGTRSFNDYEYLKDKIANLEITEIVCGLAKGADTLGQIYGIDNSISVKRFPAEWEKHGKGAGFVRNEQMGRYADIAVIFWDGESKGTKHMIDFMNKLKKPIIVHNYNDRNSNDW